MKRKLRQSVLGAACSFLLLSFGESQATEEKARELLSKFRAERDAWITQVQACESVEQMRALEKLAPDPDIFGRNLLGQIDGSWAQPWFLDYATPLIELAPAYAVTPLREGGALTPLSVIREQAEKFHFTSPKIGPLALVLVRDTGPKTRVFLEKIESTHPDPAVQGQAALALAILSIERGQGGKTAAFHAQRFDWIRKAITTDAFDMPMGETTVGVVAQQLLFFIENLEQGTIAPDINNWNEDGKAMRLSDFRGEALMMVFWNENMPAVEETLAFMKKVQGQVAGRGGHILGVAAEDAKRVRELRQEGTITWSNWLDSKGKIAKLYQVRAYPACWVVDKTGKIIYRGVPGAFAELALEGQLISEQ